MGNQTLTRQDHIVRNYTTRDIHWIWTSSWIFKSLYSTHLHTFNNVSRGFCVQNSQVSCSSWNLYQSKIEWNYSYHILGHVRSYYERHVHVLNNWGMLIQRGICPWVNEDRFKRKWILTDIKQSTIKAAQYNGMMVFFILRRVSVKGKRTGIKMLERFHTPSKCVSIYIYIFLNMSNYSSATCHVQGCVRDKTVKRWLKGIAFHIEMFLNVL